MGGNHVKANDDEHGALENDARQQRRDGARSLGERIGHPGVHGKDLGLGAKANHDKRKGQAHDRRVELIGLGQHARKESGHVRIRDNIGGVGVDQQRAKQAKGDTGRADHDVFPRGLEGVARVLKRDQQGRGQRGGLDGRPHNYDVVGRRGQKHREQEQAVERVVLLYLIGSIDAVGDELANQADRVDGDAKADDADDEHEQSAQGVDMEPRVERPDLAAVGKDGQRDGKRAGEHDNGRDGMAELKDATRGGLGNDGHDGGQGQGARNECQKHCGSIHVPSPSDRRGRANRATGRCARS